MQKNILYFVGIQLVLLVIFGRLYFNKSETICDGTIVEDRREHINLAPVTKKTVKKVSPTNTPRIGTFHSHFFYLAAQILDKTASLAILRYGDGELALINGTKVGSDSQAGQQDNWSWEGGVSKLGKQIYKGWKRHLGQNVYYGLPMYPHNMWWIMKELETDVDHITYANIFVNSNYKKTLLLLDDIFKQEKVVLVVNEEIPRIKGAKLDALAKEVYPIPDGVAAKWEANEEAMEAQAVNLAKKYTNTLFIFAAGPLAKALITIMFNANPRNRYVDFGSSTDQLLKERVTRGAYIDGQFATYSDPDFQMENNELWVYGPGYPWFTYNIKTDK
jgi:hypothetical protein